MVPRTSGVTSCAARPGSVGCMHAQGLAIFHHVIRLPAPVLGLLVGRSVHVGRSAARRGGTANILARPFAILWLLALT